MSIRSHRGSRVRGKRTELSEMVTRRARDTAALVASIRVRKADVASALGQRFMPALRDGETVPDYELALELAGRSVQLAFDRIEELDDRHFTAKAKRAHHAREVDRVAKKELYPQAVDVRRQIDDAFGREAGSDLHSFTGKTPRTATRLQQHVERAFSGVVASFVSRMHATPGARAMSASIGGPTPGAAIFLVSSETETPGVAAWWTSILSATPGVAGMLASN